MKWITLIISSQCNVLQGNQAFMWMFSDIHKQRCRQINPLKGTEFPAGGRHCGWWMILIFWLVGVFIWLWSFMVQQVFTAISKVAINQTPINQTHVCLVVGFYKWNSFLYLFILEATALCSFKPVYLKLEILNTSLPLHWRFFLQIANTWQDIYLY